MRILVILLLMMSGCWAQSGGGELEAVLQKMERAQQTGDFNTLLGLFTREKAAGFEKLRPYVTAQPEVHYRVINSSIRGDQGVILANDGANSFWTITLRREDGQWKIQDLISRDTAPNPSSVYAFTPPAPGSFAQAGSRWDQVAPALTASEVARQGWQMKAIFDESYLYIQIESSTALPAPGSTVTAPPGGWPVLKIDTSTAGEFVLFDAVNVGDQATFGPGGRANSHRAFAAYMIRLERNNREVFSASADLEPSPLLKVAGRDYEIRIPLAAMSITDSRATRMTIGDAQWPKSAVLSFAVARYPR